MKNYRYYGKDMWELVIKEETVYNEDDDSVEGFITSSCEFDNFQDAQNEFIKYINSNAYDNIVLISYITGHFPAVILAYSNNWQDDFIKIPEWAC